MSTPPKIGSTNFNDALSRINMANVVTHHCLKQFVDGDPGPETRQVLVTKMLSALADSQKAAADLTEIGKQAKTTQPL